MSDIWRPELLESEAYRSALGQILSQFVHGEEVSFEVVPATLDHFRDEEIQAQAARQIEDEKRHAGMFEGQRARLGLPFEKPTAEVVRFGDRILDMKRRGDLIGCILTGSFMLEGIAFSTLMTHREVVEPKLAEVLTEIMTDEARHVSFNMTLLRKLIEDDPATVGRLVEIHSETLPELFNIFRATAEINETLGVDNEWFTMKTLFHHAQRIRRLHLPKAAADSMLNDCLRATPKQE